MPNDDPETLVRLLQRSDAELAEIITAFRTDAIADLRAWLDKQASALTSPTQQPVAPDVPRTHVSMAIECDAPQDTTPALSFLTGDEVLAYRLACTPAMTQEALGALLGVKGREVSKWENKQKAIPLAAESKFRALRAQEEMAP